nr:immunoglobulin light chain junction region [Macaca mulatta]MOW04313.1 immunoglobulin light chain junction region [Macaca mulatta]MOW04392.1 immunoglobulin light chain junction region [Macaca mulatta]MOW04668.1 immunoglobulin light chain junction region [Macaca mulatta]MOW04989.1 immunoglobulin light chain junction region [Macaca mulatta]
DYFCSSFASSITFLF